MTDNQAELDLGIEIPDKQSWRDEAMETLLRVAARGNPFQAYDLTEAGLPNPIHPNQWGALFHTAFGEGHIVPVRWTYSNRPTRSAGVCREWISKEYADEYQNVA